MVKKKSIPSMRFVFFGFLIGFVISPAILASDFSAAFIENDELTWCSRDEVLSLLRINNSNAVLAEWQCREFDGPNVFEKFKAQVIYGRERRNIPSGFRPMDINEDLTLVGVDRREPGRPSLALMPIEQNGTYSSNSIVHLRFHQAIEGAEDSEGMRIEFSDSGMIYVSTWLNRHTETYVRRFSPQGNLVGAARGKGDARLLQNTDEIVFSRKGERTRVVSFSTRSREFGSFIPVAHEGSVYYGNLSANLEFGAAQWDAARPRIFKSIDHFCDTSRCRTIAAKESHFIFEVDRETYISDGVQDWHLGDLLVKLRLIEAPSSPLKWMYTSPRVLDSNRSGTLALAVPAPDFYQRPFKGALLFSKN